MTLLDSARASLPAIPGVPLLEVTDLEVGFPTPDGVVEAVRGLSFTLERGEVLGIVGESGSGKSVTSTAILGLLPNTARVSGSIRLDGQELVGADDRSMSAIRGKRISMVFQDPLSAFTPVYTVGQQIAETVRIHRGVSKAAARERAIELLKLVGIPDAGRRVDAFPHEFSGGMRQRAMIAMAIANDPDVILADEPTTALDVTIQAQIIAVLRKAQREAGAALVFVSHDLGVIAGFADRIAVMYAGRIVETATADDLFTRPRMPYTVGLIGALPRLDRKTDALVPIPGTPPSLLALAPGCPFAARCPLVTDLCRAEEPALDQAAGVEAGHRSACHHSDRLAEEGAEPDEVFDLPEIDASALNAVRREDRRTVLHVDGLVKTFPLLRGAVFKRTVGRVWAVDGVDLDIREGETLGLVGESGSGKSTTLHEIMDLRKPEAGSIRLLDTDLATSRLDRETTRGLRSDVSMVFQDPMASLDPRQPVSDIIAEPLRAVGRPNAEIARRVPELMRLVGLDATAASRFPHEFSGGQRQRISIARALAASPRLIVLDEPVSALDVSIQAGVLNLLRELKARLSLSYLFVSHDLSVIRHVADRVSVMYLGRTVETGEVDEVFEHPLHPYTQALLSAVPVPDPRRERAREHILLQGDPPNPTEKQVGCRFRGRCPVFAMLGTAEKERCATEVPAALPHGREGQDHTAACHFPQEKQLLA